MYLKLTVKGIIFYMLEKYTEMIMFWQWRDASRNSTESLKCILPSLPLTVPHNLLFTKDETELRELVNLVTASQTGCGELRSRPETLVSAPLAVQNIRKEDMILLLMCQEFVADSSFCLLIESIEQG